MFQRFSTFILAAFLSVAAGSHAQASQPSTVHCVIGSGRQATDLTIIIPDAPKKAPSRVVEISVIPGVSDKIPAVATFVPKIKSEINQDFAQVIFQTSDQIGFVVRIAANGDSVSFPVDRFSGSVGEMHFGRCDLPEAVFDIWY